MATELLPLLTDDSSPVVPGGEYVPPTSGGDQDTADVIAEYLDFLNPALRQSSLAKMAYDEARSIRMILTSPDSPTKQASDLINSVLPLLPPQVAAVLVGVNALLDQLNSNPAQASPTLRTKVDTIASSVAGGASWWGTVPFDATDPEWVLVGTSTFTDFIHFEEEGHVYLVSLIAPIMSRSKEIIDLETVHFGAGWIAEMAGTARGERHFLDFSENIYHRDGHLMRGALVNLPKGGDGQIAAYKYTPT